MGDGLRAHDPGHVAGPSAPERHLVRSMPAGTFLEALGKPLEHLCGQELAKRGSTIAESREYTLPFFIGGLCATYET